jgi:TIR domain
MTTAAMRNVHVFLSYVDEDRKAAEALIEELQEHGIKWFSYLHVPRLLGTNARMKIAQAIQGAHYVVILWSRHTTSSSWVLDELRHAMSTGKPILPVLLDDGVPLPPPLDQLEGERGFDNPAAWARRVRQQIEIHCGRRLPAMPIPLNSASGIGNKAVAAGLVLGGLWLLSKLTGGAEDAGNEGDGA